MLTEIRHTLAHRLGWNRGRVVSWIDTAGDVVVGFRCDGCGWVSGIHRPNMDQIIDRALAVRAADTIIAEAAQQRDTPGATKEHGAGETARN